MADLWNITHESNDLTEYDSTQVGLGDLSTSVAAALASTGYGLDILIDDTDAIYGQVTQTAPASGGIRWRIHVDINSLTMASGDAFVICQISASANPWYIAQLKIKYDGADYKVRSTVVEDDASALGNDVTITDAEHYIEVYLERAASAISGDGQMQVWIDGSLEVTRSSLDNYDNFGNMNYIRFGATAEIDAGTSGTFYMDEFKANDDGGLIGAAAGSSTSTSTSTSTSSSSTSNSTSTSTSTSSESSGTGTTTTTTTSTSTTTTSTTTTSTSTTDSSSSSSSTSSSSVSYEPDALDGMPGTEYGDSTYYGGSTGSAGLGAYCWKIIIPQGATNRCLNPSAGTTGNFAAVVGSAARSSLAQKFGLYSYLISTSGDNEGVSFTLDTLTTGVTVSMYTRGTLPTAWDWSLDDATYHEPQVIMNIDGDWTLYAYSFGTGEATGSSTLYVRQKGAGSGAFYLDGVQVENGTDWTTFIDGDQEGCVWNGAAHASASTRSAESRAGGLVRDFKLDYGFGIADAAGWGAAQQSISLGRYATLPGGELDNIKQEPRRAILAGPLRCSSTESVNDRRQALLTALSSSTYPRSARGYQPVRLWYICSEVVKEIAVHYESGLDMAIRPDDVAQERIAIRFVADDPNWYEIGTSAIQLDTQYSASFATFYARLHSQGTWSALGGPSMTASSGSINTNAVLHASDHKIYLGGDWTDLAGIANADRIAYYDPYAKTFSAMGTGIGNGAVRVIREAPNGDIYVAGEFTDAGGVVAADYIARWDGSTWTAVGTPAPTGPVSPIIYDMAFDRSGNLYVVGNFEDFTGTGSDMYYIAKWSGSTWSAVGFPASLATVTSAYAVAIDSEDNVWVGGDFINWAADVGNSNYWSKWNGTSWDAPFPLPASGVVRALWVDPKNDDVYVGGAFTNANGVANADRVFRYDGTAVRALSTGMDATVWAITGAPDGMIYLAGTFTTAGGVAVSYISRWNGASFVHMDIDTNWVFAIEVGQVDPAVERNYDLWVGGFGIAAQTFYYAGNISPYVPNSGTSAVYPKLRVKRLTSAGTSVKLKTLRNETSGHELYFDYSLRGGETLTVDLDPRAKSVMSSFYGRRLDAVLANSDMGQWRLRPGQNRVSCFVNTAGSTSWIAWLEWRDAYNGLD